VIGGCGQGTGFGGNAEKNDRSNGERRNRFVFYGSHLKNEVGPPVPPENVEGSINDGPDNSFTFPCGEKISRKQRGSHLGGGGGKRQWWGKKRQRDLGRNACQSHQRGKMGTLHQVGQGRRYRGTGEGNGYSEFGKGAYINGTRGSGANPDREEK